MPTVVDQRPLTNSIGQPNEPPTARYQRRLGPRHRGSSSSAPSRRRRSHDIQPRRWRTKARKLDVSLGAALGIALTKVGAAAVTGSSACPEASHSLADTANDLLLFVAQRRSSHPPDHQHALGYGREAFFWALLAALGVLVAGVAFYLRTGIEELIHPGATSSFAVAYVVLAISSCLICCRFASQGARWALGRVL